MLNKLPGRLGLKLTTPFELVHNSKTDAKTWFEVLSKGYFNYDKDNAESHSKQQSHTLDGISVGRDNRSNSIIFYNPTTSSYYRPTGLQLDKQDLPSPTFLILSAMMVASHAVC